jgi:hypothetical protein
MSIGLFVDKNHQPTDAEVRQVVGSKFPLWEALIRFIRENHPAQEDFKFLYGRNYGWAWRFRIKGQLLTSLYPTKVGFTVQINLSPEAVEKAQSMKLTKNAQLAIERANPYPEGRWLFIPVETKSDLQSVEQLLALRVEVKHPPKISSA